MKIQRIHIDVFRAPIEKQVVTSFGTIPSRAMATLRLEDSDGVIGWGDIWGNFPTITTEYRAKLAAFTLPDLLLGKTVDDIPEFYHGLVENLHVLAVQADEPGPVASVLAAVDQALWDLAARRANQPLCKMLNANAKDRIPAYASGLNPGDGPDVVEYQRAQGHRNFKLKIGFGEEIDKGNVHRIVDGLSPGERFFVDANQRWNLEQAIYAADWLAEAGVGWFEEPMPADTPDEQWRKLKAAVRLPLAGAENLRGMDNIETAFAWLDYIQPDVGKWGGVTDCFAIANKAIAAGKTYCPHWLAGGVGMLHSAHMLAAAGGSGGGDGLLEMDVNENPLRDHMLGGALSINNGVVDLPSQSGIGIAPDLAAIEQWRVDKIVLD
ncbi:MAG: mandelate racemase/muconate lactonizing enzyme family protein [Alphaproteobacteria bacterium]|nr:mandelate racemase/muconate lactonizing enzyme family protein [Alphaproteobacteria bacterium]